MSTQTQMSFQLNATLPTNPVNSVNLSSQENTSQASKEDNYPGLDLLFTFLSPHPLFAAAVWLYRVGLALIVLAGLAGNVMILVLQPRMDKGQTSSLSVLIVALALSDSAMLLVSGATWYGAFTFKVALVDVHPVMCKVLWLVIYVCGVTSPWLLVAMTVQRAASIVWPHRIKAVWTARRGAWTVGCIVVTSALLNAHILYGRELRTTGKGRKLCLYASPLYERFFDQVWPSVDIAISSFVPFLLIAAANVVLVSNVWKSLRDAKRHLAAGESASKQLEKRESKASSMTVSMAALSLAFILLTSPLGVFFVLSRTGGHAVVTDMDSAAKGYFAEAVGNLLWMINNGVNFYVYLLTGSRYRSALAAVFPGGSCSSRLRG